MQRQQQLEAWLAAELYAHGARWGVQAQAAWRMQALAGDASARHYSRVHTQDKTLILMDAPNQREDCQRFIDISARLAGAGLTVPEVLASDLAQGFLLLSDLGDTLYLDRLNGDTARAVSLHGNAHDARRADESRNDDTADALYGDALRALRQMQEISTNGLPDFDATLFTEELHLFTDWLLDRHLGLGEGVRFRQELEPIFTLLIRNALQQPQVFVHRDYHSRNLTCLDDSRQNPGILDYQDAVCGPITYDVVSLLRDCYLGWPRERVHGWLRDYIRTLPEHLTTLPWSQWLTWFDLMGVQRQLKAAGIFARLWQRDSKRGYLADIPRTLGYISKLGTDYPALAPLCSLIDERVLPRLADVEATPAARQAPTP